VPTWNLVDARIVGQQPAPPSPKWLDALGTDWRGFLVPFMHAVFTEPDSEDVIAEMTAIGLDS
jgi:hypothetical protein